MIKTQIVQVLSKIFVKIFKLIKRKTKQNDTFISFFLLKIKIF